MDFCHITVSLNLPSSQPIYNAFLFIFVYPNSVVKVSLKMLPFSVKLLLLFPSFLFCAMLKRLFSSYRNKNA